MVTCWERDDLLALVCGVQLCVCHFPIGILGQVCYLIVSIPDLCTLTFFGWYMYLYHFRNHQCVSVLAGSLNAIAHLCCYFHHLPVGTRNAIGSEDTDMGLTDIGVTNIIGVGENDVVLSESGAMNDIGAENLDVQLSGVLGIIADIFRFRRLLKQSETHGKNNTDKQS